MLTNTLDILVFSKDCDFSDETNDILIASKIKYNIRFAETQRELADFLKYLLKPKLIIYDSLYGGTETYDMLAKKIEPNDTLSCIFIHERSDKKLTCGLDRVISLERPFGRDAYIEALSRICFKNSGGFSDIQESGDAHDRIRSEVNIAAFRLLSQIGVPEHMVGYRYLGTAIPLVVYNPQLLHPITKSLYSIVAEKYMTTPGSVERAIRHIIERTWEMENIKSLSPFFNNEMVPKQDRPTNTLFISILADLMREQYLNQ